MSDNRNEHEGRRRKREWMRENVCPPKVKYWSERRKNLSRGGEREREREGAVMRERIRRRTRGRVRSDRVTEQKEDRKCEGRLRNSRDGGRGGKSWSAPHRPADVPPHQLALIHVSL